MLKPGNAFKRGLEERRAQSGLWVSLCSPASAEIAAHSGADWILVDMEHAPNEVSGVADQLRAAESGCAVIVRPPESSQVITKRLLDIGVKTLMFPMIDTVEQARGVVSWTRYPPHGVRGVSGVIRGNGYGRDKGYRSRLNDEICVIVQAETPQALANIAEIGAVEGVDAIFIGPGDLAAALGYPGPAEMQQIVYETLTAIRYTGKAAGVLAYGAEPARGMFAHDADFVAVGADTWLLARETSALIASVKL